MEAKLNNSEEQIRIRKAQNTMVIVGTGIIMFGIWSAIKVFGTLLLRQQKTIEEIQSYIPEGSDPVDARMTLIAALVLGSVFVIIELGIRFYIGRSAIAESRGKRKSISYIVFTFILILFALISVMFDCAGLFGEVTGAAVETENTTQSDLGTALIIDLTSLIMMTEMVVCAFRVRKHKKQQRQAEVEHAA